MLSNKRNFEEHKAMMLIKESITISQKKLSPKFNNSGNFAISCFIGSSYFDKILSHLGAHINLMIFFFNF